mgnify:CR=1 FL=1
MKTKKKVLLAFTTIIVCLIFSITTISEISKSSYTSASIKSICADKTVPIDKRIRSV